jgi:putative glycosyltransferase (TIGR04372 family)
MDYHNARLTLTVSGECPGCGTTVMATTAECHEAAVSCPSCAAALLPDPSDMRSQGKSLINGHVAALERRVGPWPASADTNSTSISNFNCYSIMAEYLSEVEIDTKAQDHISLIMALMIELNPWLHVRFGGVQTAFFGHMSVNTENYLSRRDAGIGVTDSYDIFGYGPFVANRELKRKWDEALTTSQAATVFASILPWDSPFATNREAFASQGADSAQVWRTTKPHIGFSEEELRHARRELERMGIPPGCEYVCIGERTSAYRRKILNNNKFQLTSDSRDAGFDQFSLAATALADRGHFVLRMGAAPDEELSAAHPRIIDYAGKYRSEFMDLYIGATCRFFAAPPSGVTSIASIFRRPIVYSNYFDTKAPQHWIENILFLLPHLYNKDTQAHLSLDEYAHLDQPPGDRWDNYGLAYAPNTPEEVLHACLEMDDRLSGVWTETEEDRLRQAYVRTRLEATVRGKKSPTGIPFWESGAPLRSRIGSHFLENTPGLFGPGAMTTASFEQS